jgi:threonine/homoserine/homoserine lactone efflux protein
VTELLASFALGVAAGLTPGPLHSVILSTALRRGARPAARYAFAPLISDTPPVLLSLFAAAALPDPVLRGMAIVGGLFIIWLGVRAGGMPEGREFEEVEDSAAKDYLKGAFLNMVNPNPWIFWLGAGAPLLSRAFDGGVGVGIAWLALFYLGLVGVKVVFAVVVGRGRSALAGRWLHRTVVASAVLMAGIGVWLIWLGVTGL